MKRLQYGRLDDLRPVPNVCNQKLKEVLSLEKLSMAHVTVYKNDQSLLHQHKNMSEIYFFLRGSGLLYVGERAWRVRADDYVIIPKNTPHKLANVGEFDLVHLVLATPPFNAEDVEVLKESDFEIPKFAEPVDCHKKWVLAQDGVRICELMTDEEREQLGLSLAIGFLDSQKKLADPHSHNLTDEVYYILRGEGNCHIGKRGEYSESKTVKKDYFVSIPRTFVHCLENTRKGVLKALCLASPEFNPEDFVPV